MEPTTDTFCWHKQCITLSPLSEYTCNIITTWAHMLGLFRVSVNPRYREILGITRAPRLKFRSCTGTTRTALCPWVFLRGKMLVCMIIVVPNSPTVRRSTCSFFTNAVPKAMYRLLLLQIRPSDVRLSQSSVRKSKCGSLLTPLT